MIRGTDGFFALVDGTVFGQVVLYSPTFFDIRYGIRAVVPVKRAWLFRTALGKIITHADAVVCNELIALRDLFGFDTDRFIQIQQPNRRICDMTEPVTECSGAKLSEGTPAFGVILLVERCLSIGA